jgi:hypothetical protein
VVEVDDRPTGAGGAAGDRDRERVRAVLRRIAAEAVLLQDAGEEVLADVKARRPLSDVVARGGPLVSRLCALKAAVPAAADPQLAAQAAGLREVLAHHAMLLAASLELLSLDWRSDAILEQLGQLDGFGRPAARLEALRAALGDVPVP